ncbi:MAG: GNAT family N-acetyltransferase [Spirochaetales bacterium]|nr:GNAT family N-acetyltransferase [Spirochaetales bacterium]
MSEDYILITERLGLREWKEKDAPPFIQMNLDLEVMHYFPRLLTPKESLELIERIKAHFKKYTYGLYAVDHMASGRFIGFIGLAEISFEADFTPAMEIGWRLAVDFWNKGYATEGAKAVMKLAFEQKKLEKLVSITAKLNKPSIRVMEKIGLKAAGEFNHPKLDPLDPLNRHVLYQLGREEYFLLLSKQK